jgi:alpha-L-fucosidase
MTRFFTRISIAVALSGCCQRVAAEASSEGRPPAGANEQQAALGAAVAQAAGHTSHPEAQWFPQAGLGLFIHWGIASVHGDLDLSWGMMAGTGYDGAAGGRNKVAPDEYWKLADRFRPDRYDPDKWMKAAAAAGFQYAVLTAVHHDGFTLWPSRFSAIGVHAQPGGRDLVRPFVEACRRHGLKVGLYVSPPDWYFDRQYMSFDRKSSVKPPPVPAEHQARRRALFHGRVEELLTQYGRIDLLWFDGGAHDNEIRDRARRWQPHLVINSRSCDGDFGSTECRLPKERFSGWLETCHCWQHSDLLSPFGGNVDFWGWLKEEKYKTTAWMLDSLVRLRTWGGNFLINVGPRPNGELPDIVYARFAETGRWMAHSRASVLGAGPGPYPEKCNVPVTIGAGVAYLHALPGWDGTMEWRDVPRPGAVALLCTGEVVSSSWADGVLRVTLPAEKRTALVDVVRVAWP